MRLTRKSAAALAAASSMIGLSACTGGGVGEPSEPIDESGPQSITYLVAQPEGEGDLAKIEEDLDAFEQANPDITVTLSVLPTDQLRTVLQPQLRSGSGPDVFDYDTGPGFAGVLADIGLLYDLTPAYEENDWPTYTWAKDLVTFDGKVLGVPDQVEAIGVYYNKDMFAENNIEEPTSLEDFEAANQTLLDAGITPIAFGDQEGWEGGHLLSAGLASRVGSAGMQDLVDGNEQWDSAPVVDSITTFFQQYNEVGFLPNSPAAITYDSANSLFYSGDAAMNITGTWLISDITGSADFEVGFFPFPGPDSAGIFAGGLGGGKFVSATTESPKASVKLLDWMQTQEHAEWQISQLNTIPAFEVETEGLDVDPLLKQVLEVTGTISSGDGDFGLNVDVLMSDQFNDAMWSGLQSVLAGSSTPQQVAEEMQAAFETSQG